MERVKRGRDDDDVGEGTLLCDVTNFCCCWFPVSIVPLSSPTSPQSCAKVCFSGDWHVRIRGKHKTSADMLMVNNSLGQLNLT